MSTDGSPNLAELALTEFLGAAFDEPCFAVITGVEETFPQPMDPNIEPRKNPIFLLEESARFGNLTAVISDDSVGPLVDRFGKAVRDLKNLHLLGSNGRERFEHGQITVHPEPADPTIEHYTKAKAIRELFEEHPGITVGVFIAGGNSARSAFETMQNLRSRGFVTLNVLVKTPGIQSSPELEQLADIVLDSPERAAEFLGLLNDTLRMPRSEKTIDAMVPVMTRKLGLNDPKLGAGR